ncbi:MAG: hypothetical protein JNK15_16225, partial [Planctomycetes bacterium]|nr:hypothetical protein [Planctomycetota bacterium]
MAAVLRLVPWSLVLLGVAACTAPAPEAPEVDGRDLDFGPITPAQLVAFALPEGCRPDDPLRNPSRDDPAVQERTVYGQRWTFEPQPERVVYRVESFGRERRSTMV